MILWLNGAFGVGKTTTAAQLKVLAPQLRPFDAEWVGYLVANALADQDFTDFQQLPPWRALVPKVADEVARYTGQHLVAVQAVLDEGCWRELMDGFTALGHEVLHVVLDVDAETLHRRIDADPDGQEVLTWRHEHVDAYLAARGWLFDSADLVVDTVALSAQEAADQVLALVPAVAAE